MNFRRSMTGLAGATACAVLVSTQVQAGGGTAVDNDLLNEMKRMIEQQQRQLDEQAAEIAELKEQLAGNTEAIAAKADKEALADTDTMVSSSFANVDVGLYGHFNRAMLYVNNGDSSKWYPVDNQNSNSRLGLRASVDAGPGWQIGGRFEYGIVSNASSAVNSRDTFDSSGDFKLRWAEVSISHDRFGKLSLGKGDTATNSASEVDLSGTSVATYASYTDMAGSIYWYDSASDNLTDIQIKNVFSGFDGLSRQDRIRYDTPSLAGFSLGASGSSGDAFDTALRYSRDYNGTKVAAAVGAANPGDLKSDTDALYNGSLSVLLPMGFNATFSAGYADLIEDDRDNPTNWWGKLGYQRMFIADQLTSFSIDYGETSDLRIDGETGKSWALAAVHNVSDWATEFYLAYRGHKLDSDELDVDDIHTFWTGARLKF